MACLKALGGTGIGASFGAILLGCLMLAGCAEEVSPASGVDCSAHASCGVEGPSCAAGEECIAIPGCSSAVCIDSAQACLETCGESCLILESFPAQLRCENGQPVPGRNGDVTGGELDGLSCAELGAERAAELASIQSCSADVECGQELTGTSCGCTRNLVARAGADVTRFREILSALERAECDSLVTTCDCPPADGFVCNEGRCTWNYTGVAP